MLPSMSKNHVIIGTGKDIQTKKSVVVSGLRDSINEEEDTIAVAWYGGKPSPALSHVYDYLLDMGVQFLLLYKDGVKVPDVFSKAEKGVTQKVEDFAKTFAAHRNGGAAFVLGEDKDTDDEIIAFHELDPIGLLDLSNNLIPISVDDGQATPPPPAPEPSEEEEEEEEEEDTVTALSFSQEDLEGMPDRVLARVASTVLDPVPDTTEEILKEIAALRPQATTPPQEKSHTPMSVEDLFVNLLAALSAQEKSRENSLTITKVEEGLLWYHYGADIRNFSGE